MGFQAFFCVFVLTVVALTVDARLPGRKLRDGEMCDSPGFYADAEDCRKFYRCAEHPTEDENKPLLVRYTFRCPNGTVFDEELSTCNHPEAVMNKPANCVIYDPDMGEENGDNSAGENENGGKWNTQPQYVGALGTGGLILRNPVSVVGVGQQPQHQITVPFIYPGVAIPYANLIPQYG